MNTAQKRAISYAITARTRANASLIYEILTKRYGVDVKPSKYPLVTIRRCDNALNEYRNTPCYLYYFAKQYTLTAEDVYFIIYTV